jgi:hypothetical protein
MNKAFTSSHTAGKALRNRRRYPLLSLLAGVVILVAGAVSASASARAAGATQSQGSPMSAAQLAAITGSDITSPKSPAPPMSPEAAETQGYPKVAYNSTDNEYLVVWEDERNSTTTDWDIYGQRVSVDGTLLGGNFPISTAVERQRDPAVAYNSTDNEYLVVWHDSGDPASDDLDTYGQRVSSAGTLVGDNFPISTAAGYQWHPAVAYNSAGNEYLVVWEDFRNFSLNYQDIYGQRVGADGTLAGGNFPISSVAEIQVEPSLTYNSANNAYLVVWRDLRNRPTTMADVYGQIVSSSASLVGGNFAISLAAGDQWAPEVAYNSTDNEYLVVWWDLRNGLGNSDVYGRRVSGAGAVLGGEVPISTVATGQSGPSVAYNSTDNEYLVAWYDHRNYATNGTDIYGQRVSGAGTLAGGNFAISTLAESQFFPSVVYNTTDKEYLVVLEDDRDWRNERCGSGPDIYGQIVSGAGASSGSSFNITPDEVCTLGFADVPPSGEGSTFHTFIRFLTCKGIVSGYACGGAGEACNAENDPYYRPGANVTRGQLSKIIANSAGLEDEIPQGQQQFADVLPGSPFYQFVERLAASGAISGYPCGGAGAPCDDLNRPYFRPNSPATRGQISKIVATAAGFGEDVPADQQTFTDVPPTSPFWAYIERLATRGVISGYNDPSQCPSGTPCFRYNDNTTRGQMAKIATNAFFPGCQAPTRP